MSAIKDSKNCKITGKGSFSRGIHPPDRKELAEDVAIEVLPTPGVLRIPVVQHIGKPSKATVKSRVEVVMGEKIGDADGFISTSFHSSLNGQTAKAGVTTLPNGRHVATIPVKVAEEQPLEGDALYDAMIGGEWPKDVTSYDASEISKQAVDAGIVGLGGAAFPTHVKLMKNDEQPVEALLINGCECEPYLTADYRLMLESPGSIVAGALLAQHANGAKRVIIGVEDNKPKAIEALIEAAEGTCVEVKALHTKYPQGGEKQLVMAMLDKAVPNGGLPLAVGAVVMNVGTVSALAKKIIRGQNLTHRVVTVTGKGIKNPKNILAPIGSLYKDLVEFAGGLTEDAARVVSGGPMMGFAVGTLETPVTKGTSGISVFTEEEVKKADETNCVRCGRCVDVCPLGLVPTKLGLAARYKNPEVLNNYHVNVCMECGCCSYTCPASLPLVQLIRLGKIIAKNES